MEFHPLPDTSVHEINRAALAALNAIGLLPTYLEDHTPKEVMAAIDTEIELFRSSGEREIKKVYLACLSALYGSCFVRQLDGVWMTGPEDEGSILYVVAQGGEGGWVNPSDSIAEALSGRYRGSLSSNFDQWIKRCLEESAGG